MKKLTFIPILGIILFLMSIKDNEWDNEGYLYSMSIYHGVISALVLIQFIK